MKLVELQPVKTYATFANAQKAAESKFGHTDLRYMVMTTNEGRFFPVFIGERAMQHCVHFHFNIVA